MERVIDAHLGDRERTCSRPPARICRWTWARCASRRRWCVDRRSSGLRHQLDHLPALERSAPAVWPGARRPNQLLPT